MKKLLKIELIKTLNNATFKVILILHLVLFLLLVYLSTRVDFSIPGFSTRNMFMFPNVWGLFSWFASWFNLLFLGIIIAVLVGNEFVFRTARLQITNGLSRNALLTSKIILILLVAAWGMILVFLASTITGLIFTDDLSIQKIFEGSYIVLIYFVQAIGYMCFALLMASLFKSNALSIMMYLLYFIMIEPLFRLFFPKIVRPYFPVKIISGLTPVPEFLSLTSESQFITSSGKNQLDLDAIGLMPSSIPVYLSFILGIVYISLFILITWWIIKRKDL